MSNFGRSTLNICTKFVQSLLPHDCVLCGAPVGAGLICGGCEADLPWHDAPACPVCGQPEPSGSLCGACLRCAPAFGRTVAAFDYRFPVDALIQRYKYGGELALATPLAHALVARAAGEPRPDLVLPMPLHADRLRERGFNQALEIARIVAAKLDLPLDADACSRSRHTVAQADLPWKERSKNVRGCFACDARVQGRHVVLVDDVMTTGATLNELAATLRRQGAAEVSVWVVARTLRD